MFDALVEGLFPEDVSVAWGHVGPHVELFPEERALVAQAVPKRQREFAQGRECARRALAALGVARCPLLVGTRREPLWPSGVVGSISHDRELSVAVAGSAQTFAGLGVDVEPDEPLTSEVAARIWSSEEARRAGATGLMPLESAAKLVFSAKEAVYKCQFSLTQSYVGFHAVSVELGDGTFEALFVDRVGPLAAGQRLQGRWRRSGGKLLTAVWLRRIG
jgi:4'-phosphopantetheinyl transferase EntD